MSVSSKNNDTNSVRKDDSEDDLFNFENEEEEDVPSDFFDDFSNQDFMEGLDIVDAWDEDEQSAKPVENTDESKTEAKKGKHPRIKFSDERERLKEKERKLQQSILDLREKLQGSKNIKCVPDKPEQTVKRRDPEKTKRDIQRDKVRCARDKKNRIINEKLKVVETGLVPPGTEMDIDIRDIQIQKKTRRESPRMSRSRSPDRRKPRRYPNRSRSRERIPYAPRSPKRYTYKSRSPNFPDRRNRSRTPDARSRKSSAYKRLSRDSSPRSDYSDRERWLRRRERRSYSPKKSPSLRRKKSRLTEKEEQEKKSFLEEIREKLNETSVRPAPMPMMQPQFMPQPLVPQSGMYMAPQMVPAPQYDQQFFIGPCDYMVPNPQMVMMAPVYEQPTPVPVPAPVFVPQCRQLVSPPKERPAETADVAKLFEDQKISLSDFLSITAKPSDATPENLQNKIKVISRCQEALKELGDESTLSGRLFVKKTVYTDKPPEGKYVSPLRKMRVARLRFTTLSKSGEEKSTLTSNLNKLMMSIGLAKEPESPPPPPPPIAKEPPRKVRTPVSKPIPTTTTMMTKRGPRVVAKTIRPQDSMLGVKFQMKTVQTDPYKCAVCESSKVRKFVDQETQTTEEKIEKTNTSVQVSEEDFTKSSPLKSILKNQSLAHLTPAQILRQSEQKDDESPKPLFPAMKKGSPKNRFSNEKGARPRGFNDFGRGGAVQRLHFEGPRNPRPLFQPQGNRPFFEPPQDRPNQFGYGGNRRFL